MDTIKLCVTCKHHRQPSQFHYHECHHPESQQHLTMNINVVTGESRQEQYHKTLCANQRDDDGFFPTCGPDGRWHERKLTWRDRYRLWLENRATDEQVFVLYMMSIVGTASVIIGLLALVGWL